MEFLNSTLEALNPKKKVYKCEYCKMEFDKGCALGGHVSRSHTKIKQNKNLITQKQNNSFC